MNRKWMIYIHIPFCVKKCRYCDFYSLDNENRKVASYVNSVISEIEENLYSKKGIEVSSVFFGGGTPSSIDASYIAKILNKIRECYRLSGNAEITVECNPGTVTAEKLKAYREMGINRLSIGAQSMNNEILKRLGRIHSKEDILSTVSLVKECGFTNFNIDLMSGLPSDTYEEYIKGLREVIGLAPSHISVYSLIIEENTPFYSLYNEKDGTKKEELLSDEEDRRMYEDTVRILEESGYHQYEISNFAEGKSECRQNVGYWSGEKYLGFGAAAASYIGDKRFKNALSLDYLDLPYEETEELTKEDQMAEFCILGLRMNRGIRKDEFEKRFGEELGFVYSEALEKSIEEGLLATDGESYFLTIQGRNLANIVWERFLL